MTGLLNASGYLHRITKYIAEEKPLSDYCAFYFNLKDFGDINRIYGREKGDIILWKYAMFLEDFMEDDEILGHLGGDNFMALVKKTKKDDFIKVISEVVLMIDTEKGSEDVEIPSTIGVWEINGEVKDPEM